MSVKEEDDCRFCPPSLLFSCSLPALQSPRSPGPVTFDGRVLFGFPSASFSGIARCGEIDSTFGLGLASIFPASFLVAASALFWASVLVTREG